MFQLREIKSLEDPALAPYRSMRRSATHEALGIFIAEGNKVVQRLLADTRFGVVSVLLTPEHAAEYTALLDARPEYIEVFVADRKLLEQIIGFVFAQGVLAIGKIPPPPALEAVLANSPRPLLLGAIDALANSENVGSIIRTCAAFGVHTLIVGETCASPWLRRSVRASMGNIFQLPIIEAASLTHTLRGLRDAGVHVVAAHPHVDGRTLTQARFTGDCCIVMGSEGTGIRPEVLAACDEAVAIRMPPTVDSLNVTIATSVFLYEACRQRGRM
jgi:tRNA G18 (ribose-2'-O)-methylase SpoU